jgi:hypothetical protein
MGKKISYDHLIIETICTGSISDPEKSEAKVCNNLSVAGTIFLVLLEEFLQVYRKRLLE